MEVGMGQEGSKGTMKTASRHLRVITLTDTEDKQVSELQKKRVKVIEIFRKGLSYFLRRDIVKAKKPA